MAGREESTTGLGAWALAASVAVATAIAFVIIAPRFRHSFPSMVDDWNAIAAAPDNARVTLRLGNPEPERYRPGWTLWNVLQWHTFGAPRSFLGPQIWNLLRVLALVGGLVLATEVLSRRRTNGAVPAWLRWLLVTSVPLALVTVPGFAVDIARYGPQEPLLVGCMAAGAALLFLVFGRLLRGEGRPAATWTLAGAGLLLWAFGVLQKETSIAVLVLVPFVLLELRREAVSLRDVGRADRRGVALLTAAMLLPLVPMLVRTAGLAIAGKNFYAGRGASGGLVHKTVLQAKSMPDAVGTKLILLLFVLAVVAVVVAWARTGVDWIAVGLLGAGFGTVLFAAKAGVVTSRYYIPAAAVAAIVLARSASRLGRNATAVAATALLALALVQAHKGHTAVSRWVDAERQQEQVVRQAAMRSAGGCRVAVTGSNAELVAALPVLVPLARERPGGCEPGERFVVVIDGGGERVSTAAGDAVIRGCEPSVEVARVDTLARILRCSSA